MTQNYQTKQGTASAFFPTGVTRCVTTLTFFIDKSIKNVNCPLYYSVEAYCRFRLKIVCNNTKTSSYCQHIAHCQKWATTTTREYELALAAYFSPDEIASPNLYKTNIFFIILLTYFDKYSGIAVSTSSTDRITLSPLAEARTVRPCLQKINKPFSTRHIHLYIKATCRETSLTRTSTSLASSQFRNELAYLPRPYTLQR